MGQQLTVEMEHSKPKDEKPEVDFHKVVTDYLFGEWLNQYPEQKFIATTSHETRLTSTISDMPGGSSNQFRSVTELAAVKSAEARLFIERFHNSLETLPKDFQLLIEKKYLQHTLDDMEIPDDIVRKELHLPRNIYFKKKKKALFSLGWLLLHSECS